MHPVTPEIINSSNSFVVSAVALGVIAIVAGLTSLVLKMKPKERRIRGFGDEFALPRRLSRFNMVFGPLAIVLAFKATEVMDFVSITAAVLFYFAGLLTMRFFHPDIRFEKAPALYLNYASVLFGVCVLIFNHYSFVQSIPHINLRNLTVFVVYLPVLAVAVSAFSLFAIKTSPSE